MRKNSILIVAIGFLPNIGGLETHLKDLIDELVKKDWQVNILTYQPLNTPVLGKWIENGNNLNIYRLPVIQGVFYKLLKNPILEFLFLEPLLFIATPLLLLKHSDIQVINGQGLIAGFAASFWSKVFKKRYVVSAQSVYRFPETGLYKCICSWIFASADKVIAISKQTAENIEKLGVNKRKIQLYTNWENPTNYNPVDRNKAKVVIGFKDKFIVSFFGRLVEEKGVSVLLETIKLLNPQITVLIYGEGPLKEEVERVAVNNKNFVYMGTVTPDQLSVHYSGADIVVMPSLHEEGFGRVASGALLCGTPVIASNRGALPDVINDSVGRIVDPTPPEISKAVNFYFSNKQALKKCALNAREYAMSKFGPKNADTIISAFSETP